jgi:hypothetical protein
MRACHARAEKRRERKDHGAEQRREEAAERHISANLTVRRGHSRAGIHSSQQGAASSQQGIASSQQSAWATLPKKSSSPRAETSVLSIFSPVVAIPGQP